MTAFQKHWSLLKSRVIVSQLLICLFPLGGCVSFDESAGGSAVPPATEGEDVALSERVEASEVASEGQMSGSSTGSVPSVGRQDWQFDGHWLDATYLLDAIVMDVGEWRSDSENGEFPWLTPPARPLTFGYITVTLEISSVIRSINSSEAYADVNVLDRFIVRADWDLRGPEEKAFIEGLSQGDRVFAFITEYASPLYASHPPETALTEFYFSPSMVALRETISGLEVGGYDVGFGSYNEMFRVEGDDVYSAFVDTPNGDDVLSASAFLDMFESFIFEEYGP